MKLGEILKQEAFARLEVLNKQADLSREVSTVESTETPDVVNYLAKNTLVLTTAMTYKNNESDICRLIRELDVLPCAGLAIKLGRFVNRLGEEVLSVADELGFPLIKIPLDFTLGEVYHRLLSYIWDDRNIGLTEAFNTQKKFTELIVQGADIKVMLNNLGNIIHKQVAIINPFGKVMETNVLCMQENKLLAEKVFEERELYKNTARQIRHYIDKEQGGKHIFLHSLNAVGKKFYYLCIFDMNEGNSLMSALVIEQVSLVLGISLYKNLYVAYNEIQYRKEYWEVLSNKYKQGRWNSAQLLALGEKFGIKPAPVYNIVVGTLNISKNRRFDEKNLSYQEERYIITYKWLEKEVERIYHKKVLVFPDPENFSFIILIQGKSQGLREVLVYFHETMHRLLQLEIFFSIGNSMTELEDAEHSYHQALESFFEGESKDKISFIKYYKPKNALELLKQIPRDQAEDYCLYILKSLACPQDEMTRELRRTLQVYLFCKCSIAETANRLFLHRNTVKYRINKCRDTLGGDFADENYCFQLQLALLLGEA